MKLLILTQYFPPEVGAPQNRLFELALRLQKKNIEVTILTAMPNYPEMKIHKDYEGKKYVVEEMSGLKVHRTSIYIPKSKSIFQRLLNYFSFVYSSWNFGRKKLESFDFLMVESPPLFLGISAYFLSRKLKAKMIFNVSDLWPESAEKLGLVNNRLFLWMAYKLEKFLYQKSVLVTGQTQGICDSVSNRFPETKVYWLPNGVDVNYFIPQAKDEEWRNSVGVNTDDFVCLYAGILGHAQGLEVILHCADKLKSESKIKFILLGSGPEEMKLKSLATELKLNNIIFHSVVGKMQMPKIVSSCDVALVPLKRLDLFKGAIPSKIFENLAMQKPILLGVEGEAKTLFIDQGNCGLAFVPEDAEDLKEKVLHLYRNPQLCLELGIQARKYVSENFNRDAIAEKFRERLRNV